MRYTNSLAEPFRANLPGYKSAGPLPIVTFALWIAAVVTAVIVATLLIAGGMLVSMLLNMITSLVISFARSVSLTACIARQKTKVDIID